MLNNDNLMNAVSTMQTFFVTDGPVRREIPIHPGLSLAQSLFLAGGFAGRPLCSGAGRCGLCRVRFAGAAPDPLPEDLDRISRKDLDRGHRLSCARPPLPGSTVEASLDRPGPDPAPFPAPDPAAALGIDLGTTAVKWRLEADGRVLAEGGGFNPQLPGGMEVMSRLALARHPLGAARLRQVMAERIRDILAGLPVLPGSICLAGNPAMIFLALGLDASGLAAAPYRLDHPGGGWAGLGEGLPEAWIAPHWAPFVGGDVSAGYCALAGSDQPPRAPWLLADLGTNGEFALVDRSGAIHVASVPMGPALEGVGMRAGVMAAPGAAVAFAATPRGLEPVLYGRVVPGGEPRGVSGTGYLSLLAGLRALGVIVPAGGFARQADSPLAARVLAGLDVSGPEPRLSLGGLELFASDVEALLKVKAAVNAAVNLLLDAAGLSFPDLADIRLAGALGEHVRPADLETLGFLPPGASAKVRAAGNTALAGACRLAADARARQELKRVREQVRPVEVARAPGFQNLFLKSMRFDHV